MKSLLVRMVRLFPAAFRERFEREMAEQIVEDCDRASARGPWHALTFGGLTALDLLRCAIAERWQPTYATQVPPTRGVLMQWLTSGWGRDLRLAVRALKRSPGFAVVTIGTLGLAIGVNAGIFSVVDAVLLRPLPFPEPDRLVYIGATAPGSDFSDEFEVAPEFYVHYKEESKLLEDIAIYTSFTASLRVDDRTERIRMAGGTTSLFHTMGVTPLIGRLPTAEDEDRAAVISHTLWTTWFGGDSAVLGRSYHMAGENRVVVGVMRPDFIFPRDDALLWLSFVIRPEDIGPGRFGDPLVGRLRPGVTIEALTEELGRLARQLPERYGGPASYARLIEKHRPVVRPLAQQLVGNVSGPLWVLFGSVGLVLLIACANVANLFLVRAEGRQRDLAVRRAIGAGRGDLFRSQISEAVVVAGLAGMLALAFAWVSMPLYLRFVPPNIPRIGQVSMGAGTLLFTLLASVASALLCGLVPAVRSSEPSLDRLRDGSRGSTRRRHWARDGLVVAQTALALVLLIGSGLLMRSFLKMRNVDPGYETKDIFTFQIAPEGGALTDAAAFARFHLSFMDRLAAMPGVQSVGIVDNVPLNEGLSDARFLPSERAGSVDEGTLLGYTSTAGDYFTTMGIQLLAGRVFTSADQLSELGNVVLSRSAANLLWPGQDPIGRRLQRDDMKSWETVVGVVEDVMQDNFRDPPPAVVYFPLVGQPPAEWMVSSPAYVVKTGRAETIGPEIREIVRQVDPNAPMYRMFTMAGLASDSMVQLSFTMLTLGIISFLAVLLGTIGQYGVLSYIVAERTREIGVRMALGAQARRVQRMVVAQGARVVLLGVVAGVVVAAGTTRALGSLLFGVKALDLATFVAVAAVMIVVGLLAAFVPARRASRVDPIESLRGEG